MLKIYGIKNCDTLKKTLKWFDGHNVQYLFIDYKKNPPSPELAAWFVSSLGWEKVINKRGTTWRKLDDDIKNTMNDQNAIHIIQAQPSIIKRPILTLDDNIWVGFNETLFKQFV